jgi:D-aminopeptidase
MPFNWHDCAACSDVGAGPWRLPLPVEISVEYAWSALADQVATVPGVRRPNARTVSWPIADPRFIYNWPGPEWHPSAG